MSSCHSDEAALYCFKWCVFDRSCASECACGCAHACWFRWHKRRPHKEISTPSISTWLLYAWPAFNKIILIFVHHLLSRLSNLSLSGIRMRLRSDRGQVYVALIWSEQWNQQPFELTASPIDNSLRSDWIIRYRCIHVKPKHWYRPMRRAVLFG